MFMLKPAVNPSVARAYATARQYRGQAGLTAGAGNSAGALRLAMPRAPRLPG